MVIVDANIVLRYLLNDHRELSPKAKDIIDGNVVDVPIEVLCEVVFVLLRVYKLERRQIALALKNFFNQTTCVLPHKEAAIKGLDIFSENSIDFVDSLLAGYAIAEDAKVHTFDNKLQKLLQTRL